MGLFSFLKNVGSKVFNRETEEEKAANAEEARKAMEAKLKGAVADLGLPVEELDINLNDDTAIIYGRTDSQMNKEKIVLAVGNVEGIATVDDRMVISMPETEEEVVEEKVAEFYTVKSGDSLSKIAKKVYGNAMAYPTIFEANKPMLSDPNKIYPGQVLRIPAQD